MENNKKIIMADSGQETLESMNQAVWFNQWTLNKFKSYLQGDILEVGCGIGNFTCTLADYGKVWAIDINSKYIKQLQKTKTHQTKFGMGDIEKGEYFFGDKKFDCIVCINVLEHIENDLSALNNFYKLLNKGGKLILMVPSNQFLYGEIDKSIGHYRRYNRLNLIEKLEQLDFKIIRSWKFNFLGAIGWFISGKIMKDTVVKQWKIRIFDFIARFTLPLEDVLEPPIGTSILIIAQK